MTYDQHQSPGGALSPHGDTPGRPPAAGGPNRTALFVVLGVLVAVVGVVIAALASGGDDADEADDRQAGSSVAEGTEPVTTRDAEATEPPPDAPGPGDVQVGSGDVSVLEVVEQGFSTYAVPGVGLQGSFGLLIENTGDAAIVGAPLEVTVLDEAGGVIETVPFTIGMIGPGETVGYGAELIWNPTNGIGEIEVQIRESTATYESPAEGTLTASDVSTSYDGLQTLTTFTVSSTYSEPIEWAETYAIYRDVSGRIIGGGQGIVNSVPPGGQLTGTVFNLGEMPTIADTEVYVDPAAVEV